jgi:pyrroline-5-carboxylate reductase
VFKFLRFENMQIQIIGCGKMGEAILRGILDSGVLPQDIFAQEKYQEQAEHIQSTYKINMGNNPNADIVILAVKPQQIEEIDFS